MKHRAAYCPKIFIYAITAILFSSPLLAKENPTSATEARCPPRAEEVASDKVPWSWKKKAMRVRTLMASESWEKGLKHASTLRDLLFEEQALGLEAGALLAETTALRAEAELGLGNADDARWHWRVAQALFPREGGPPAPSLKPMARQFFDGHLTDPQDSSFPRATEVSRPPIPLHTPWPKKGIWPSRLDPLAAIELELLIDQEGRIRYPITRCAQPMATPLYKLLETVRSWRFTPARTEHGDPISVRLALRVEPWQSPTPAPRLAFAMRMASNDQTAPVHHLLLGGRFAEAEAAAASLMASEIACADPASESIPESVGDLFPKDCLIGEAMALRAIAAAALGADEAAVWMWQAAHNLTDTLSADGMAAYGPAGEVLAARAVRCTGLGGPSDDCPAVITTRSNRAEAESGEGGVRPAQVRERAPIVATDDPEGADRILIRVLVDEAGIPHEPTIVTAHWLKRGLDALAAVRGWRFEPARRGGVAVPSVVTVTVPSVDDGEEDRRRTWRQTLATADAALSRGDGTQQAVLRALRDELAHHLTIGGSDLLADALTLLAVADARAGDLASAHWHWLTAQNLAVELREIDLGHYGEAGALLASQRLPAAPPNLSPSQADRVPLAAPLPSFDDRPAATDLLRVRVEVDEAGVPSRPFVVEGGRSPARLMLALAALADWRFPPGAPGVRDVVIPLTRGQSTDNTDAHESDLREARALVTEAVSAMKNEDPITARCLYASAQHLVPSLAALDFSEHKPDVAARMSTLRRGPRPHWPLLTESKAHTLSIVSGIEPPQRVHWEPPSLGRDVRNAAKLGASGTMFLTHQINRDGRVEMIRTQRGLPLGLTASHIASSCRSRWQPATQNGEPVPVEFHMEIGFQSSFDVIAR